MKRREEDEEEEEEEQDVLQRLMHVFVLSQENFPPPLDSRV